MSFTSRVSARFNWHSCTIASLKFPAMIVHDVATKVLDRESSTQYNIAGLISGITFIVLLSQEKPLRWKEKKHIHTKHTHTRARARKQQILRQMRWYVSNTAARNVRSIFYKRHFDGILLIWSDVYFKNYCKTTQISEEIKMKIV